MTKFTRRQVIVSGSSVGLTALPGCTLFSKPDLRVYSATSEMVSYSVEVINQDTGKETLSRTDTVGSNQSTMYRECLKQHNVSHRITLEVEMDRQQQQNGVNQTNLQHWGSTLSRRKSHFKKSIKTRSKNFL